MKLKKIEDSPWNLLQEIYRDDPWKMLISCMFLNQTTRKQVDKIRDDFFEMYPDPETAAAADVEKMAEMIKCLGFKNMRSARIIKMSSQYAAGNWKDVQQLHGIGKYAKDSWELFENLNFSVVPDDGVLVRYVEWGKKKGY